ncbi:alpha-mannosidase [Lacticaseibacillus kribbianus]|uniref:alpha-mannosidase n=1 Tax=Lacticaseibacillus kribbianus TaxID=2926292 RepID=UPI001CD48C9D|nr:glycoside hydrolase family 38 C-terminal domain-containing protein [Lacticaseibacillus kribbianus]
MYTKDKIRQQLRTFSTYIYANFQPLDNLEIWHDERADHKPLPTPEEATFAPIALGGTWEGRDQYYWLRFDLTVPAVPEGQHYVVHLDLGRSGGGGNSGFEGLVHLNGHPRQAVDGNHKDIYLDSAWANQTIKVAILMWTGLEGGGPQKIQHYILQDVSAGLLIAPIRDCYRWLEVLYDTTLELADDEPLLYDYQKLIDKILRRFIWGAMTLDDITAASQAGLDDITAFIAAHKGQKKQFKISAIGHTHIDVAWLWRLRHTREKTARSFSTVLELMREYPEYIFMHSTPQVWQFVKEDYPELYAQIKERVKEGRFEPEGATWLEPDANIPTGEALTRQFLYGTRFFQKEFGAKQNVLWLPDVFGYSWALPQIMRGFGIENFMTTKISWNETNRMPHDTFTWKGMDGSEVLTHFITTVDPGVPYKNTTNFEYTYNGKITPHTVLGSYYVYADKVMNNDLLLSYGWGDGGGGPQREMIENIKMINQLPALPTVEPTRVDDYFKQLHANIEESGQKPAEWNGELYLEFHRGTYTSQARVKKQNRELEFAMRDLEARYVQAGLESGVAYPTEQIQKLWERILCNQFHDILPGSSIHEVYEDNKVEYQQCFDEIAALNRALDAQQLDQTADAYTVRNLNAWPLSDLVTVAEPRAGQFTDSTGNVLEAERHGDHYLVAATTKALGESGLTFKPGDLAPEADTPVATSSVDFGHYRLQWNAAGQLTSIYDRDNTREVLAADARGNVLTVYEDRPTSFDNWNIDADYPEKAIVLEADAITVHPAGALSQRIDFHYTFQKSTVEQTVILYADSRRIDFTTHADWHEHQFLLRTAFDTAILSDHAMFDVQYGNVARSTADNTSWDTAKFETVGHKWADLAQRDYGVALLNDAKYGYRVKGSQLSLSLIKSGIEPDTEADQGAHDFTYSLLPHRGDFVEGQVEKTAMALNHGLTVTAGAARENAKSLFDFDAAQPVMVDAIKHSEDGDQVILRFHEYTGENTVVAVTPGFAFSAVSQVRLDETQPTALAAADGTVKVALRPYQVVTLAFAK